VLDATDLTIRQAHFDAVRVGGRTGQNIFDDPMCDFAAALILLQHNLYYRTGADVFAAASVCHLVLPFATVVELKRILPVYNLAYHRQLTDR